jgi:anti-sigma factor RsiW
MSCDEWKAFLQDYLAGGLSDTAKSAVERHLSDCAPCFAEARAHKLVEKHLAEQPVLDVPAGLVDRIVDRAVPKRVSRFRHELLRVAAAFVAAISLGAAAVTYGYTDRLSGATDRLDSARRSIESSIRGAFGATNLLGR